jgi:hypothetical protein
VSSFLKKVNGVVLFKPVLTEELVRMVSLVMKRSHDSEQQSES